MQSQYVMYPPHAEVKTFHFHLKRAMEKTLVVHGPSGEPLADTTVFPGERKPAEEKDEFGLLYFRTAAKDEIETQRTQRTPSKA